MANVPIKISQLKSLTGSAITNDDFLPIVDSGSLKTYRITVGDLVSMAQGGVATLLGGSDKQVLYNQGGIVYGNNGLQFNYASKSLQNGSGSIANGLYSHAEGFQTYTSGVYAHSEGYTTYAYGKASHAGGYQTYAYGDYQTVVGQFNVKTPQNTSSLFIVGGGISDGNRADILLVDRTGITVNGDINFSGSLYKNGTLYKQGLWSDSGSNIFYNNGSVGVGISAPQYTLDVNETIGNSLGDLYVQAGTQATPHVLQLNVDGGNVQIGNYTSDINLGIWTANGDSFTNAAGIVNSAILNANAAYIGNPPITAEFFVIKGNDVDNSFRITDTGDNTKFVIDKNYNVGIKQSAPQNTLDVAGNISASAITASNAKFGSSNIGENWTSSSLYLTPNTNPSCIWILDADAGEAGSQEGLHVMSGSGYVGIGTDNPVTKLHVVGTISSSALTLPTSASQAGYGYTTGSMFYSGSKLFIYTGTGAAGGLTGWQTASLGG